ncbi:hypothetical protein P3X46_024997 [Hevea brasiliensis]|uniref:Uncharacterized protein n=1 Tax=Hevea brasiliensis TaxID=3981 RepID=A0ABQ9L476_HEVBR|nr:hypothetical protein P3X46_024997 [Hevea brasiliensis]
MNISVPNWLIYTHTRKGTSDMVDSRAQSIKDAFLALKEQSSQPQEGCSDPPIVDEVALYYQVVGGEKKNRVYGIGSQASIFYPSSSHGSSSSHPIMLDQAMEEEIQQLHRSRQRSRIVWLQWRREIDNAS